MHHARDTKRRGRTAAQPRSNACPWILVVDDDAGMQKVLRAVLRDRGFRTLEARDGMEALSLACSYNPEVVLIDMGLRGLDCVAVIRELRRWMGAPILVMLERGDEKGKVSVLNSDANDYITKPFTLSELLGRITIWLRQMARDGSKRGHSVIVAGNLTIDLAGRRVSVDGQEVHLTPIEYKLCATLMRNKNCVMTYRQLLEATWGPRGRNAPHYVRIYVQRLRQKLERDPARPSYFLTEHGVGYQLRSGPIEGLSAGTAEDTLRRDTAAE
ncbi:MAG TPA: response regulator [Polyangiaceae bacterium]|nr:response regulator [Polyangiaceae bacterium]